MGIGLAGSFAGQRLLPRVSVGASVICATGKRAGLVRGRCDSTPSPAFASSVPRAPTLLRASPWMRPAV
jgi:hypothetical protein